MLLADLEGAGHLVLALEMYARLCRDAGRPVPAGMEAMARDLRFQVTGGQGGSFVDALESAVDAVSMDLTLLLSYPDAGARIGVSDSTIKRLVKAGELRSVKVGSAPRIHIADLEEYADRLRDPARAEHKVAS